MCMYHKEPMYCLNFRVMKLRFKGRKANLYVKMAHDRVILRTNCRDGEAISLTACS